MKLLLFIVLLITNTICADDCTSLSTENTCKEKTGCKWTAATCTGHNTCTSKTASSSECTGTSYTEQLSCTYTAAKAATCTGNTVCSGVTSLGDSTVCEGTKYGGTACTYSPSANAGEDGTCGPSGKTECEGVSSLATATACESTYYGQTACTYTDAVSASCKKADGTACSGVSDLTSSTACESTTYDGTTSKKCVYAAGSCSAGETGKSDTNGTTNNPGDSSNTEQDNSGYIKFSLIFSLLYLLF